MSNFAVRLARACAVSCGFVLGAGRGLATEQPARSERWPSLDRVVAMAREQNVGVVDAVGQIAVARALRVGANVSILGNPYLEVYGDHGSETKGVYIQGQLFLPLDLMGQRAARVDEATRLSEWRAWGLANAQAIAMGEAVASFGQAVVAAARIAEAQRAEESARREARYFSERLAVRDTTVYYASVATAEEARWTQTRVEAELGLAQARTRLAQATGVRGLGVPPDDARVLPPDTRFDWNDVEVAEAIDHAPLVRSLRAEQTYWASSRTRADVEKYSPVSLIVSGGRGDLGEPRLGAGLAWAVPVTRRNEGEIARAEAERARAAQVEATFHRTLAARVSTAVRMYRAARRTVASLDETGIPAAEHAAAAVNEAFRMGKVELVQVLIARRDVTTARFRRLDLIELAWRAFGDLTAISGGLP